MAEFDEKTEQATPRRREKSREKGQIARSRDLSSIAAVGGIFLIFSVGGAQFMKHMERVTGKFLSLQYGEDPFSVFRSALTETMLLILPFFGAALVFAVGTNLVQGGIVIKPFELEMERINPLSGLKRIFSISGLAEFLKSLLKFLIGGCLVYFLIRKDLAVLPSLMGMGVRDLSQLSGHLILKAVAYGFFSFLVFGLADFFLERWRFERSIRMSREEIKEEHRESEGNPMLKSRIKAVQREMAKRRMMQEVPKATVVITNPTHLAVALRYEDKKMGAPMVVAKGADALAAKIREVAAEHNVPIVEDKPLARGLYKLEINSYIPEDLYKAIAKILAYIYKLKGTTA